MNILISPASEPLFLKRTLWSIARSGPRPKWRVVVASHRPEDKLALKKFSSLFPWTFLQLGDGEWNPDELVKYVEGDRFFLLDGDTIVLTNATFRPQTPDEIAKKVPPTILYEQKNSALDQLLREPEGDVVCATVCPLLQSVILDELGASIHPKMIETFLKQPLQSGHLCYLALWKREPFLKRQTTGYRLSQKAICLCQKEKVAMPPGKPASILSVEKS